ncbi:MAG: class I SAM-dependent methyltransferase [Sporichthyaceae bacterium]
MDEFRAANLANWEARVPIHLAPGGYDLDRFEADPAAISDVVAYDRERLGDLTGLRAVHLQCHIGTDTVSLARLGASVTGVDFSPSALAAAAELATRAGVRLELVECELYRAPQALAGRQFDLVYTGVGALNWLPDITGWARVVAALLAPGGRLFLREGHPMLMALEEEGPDGVLEVRYPYFHTADPLRWEEEHSYVNVEQKVAHPVTYDWAHGLGEVVTAVLAAGLRVEALLEHDECEWQALPSLVPTSGGRWALPERRERLPLMYTLIARSPE